MAIATNAQKETLAAAYAGAATYASLHNGAPGTTGANEISGGSPAYARKEITWTAGASDGVYTSNTLNFDVPAGTDLTDIGLWDAVSGGNFKDSVAISVTYASQGVYAVVLTYTQS